MVLPAVVLFLATLGALAVLQVRLAAGAPLGRYAWGGGHDVLPRRLRVGSALSVVLYGVFALVLVDRAALVEALPDAVARVGTWALLGYLVLGVVMNALSRSRREAVVMTPTCLVLAACVLVVATSP